MAYITTANAKAYLGIPSATTSDDTLLAAFIASAQAYIDAYTGRTFETGAAAERLFDAVADVEGNTLYIDHLATTDELVIVNGDSVTVTSGQYTTQPRRATPYFAIQLLASSNVTWTYTTDPQNAISVTGKWGYSVTAPDDIVQACTRLTAWLYRQKDTNAEADRPLLTGDGVAIMPSAIPSDVLTILRPYRRLS